MSWSAGCAPTLAQGYRCTLPGGDVDGRAAFGVQRSGNADIVVLDTTGVSGSDVLDAAQDRMTRYLADGLVPIGVAHSTNKGQGEPQATLLATAHGAQVAVVEIRDPPPYEREIEANVPTLMTESVWIDGTTDFEGSITRLGWAPGTTTILVDPYFVECRLWSKRSWPPALGVYFTEEMRAFRGYADQPHWPAMKSAADRWRLSHPGEPVPPRGGEVYRVLPGTPASEIGLRLMDILVSLGGHEIDGERSARAAINSAAGRRVEVVVMRFIGSAERDQAAGWQVSPPENPLFQPVNPTLWRQLSRVVELASPSTPPSDRRSLYLLC